MKKIYLIDGMGLVFKAYYAMMRSNLQNKDGLPTGALFGFANMITAFIEKESPEHIAVAFDTKTPTFRHEKYPLYKANRQAAPEDLIAQLERIKEFLDLAGIPRIEMPGFEADDVIGTLSKKAAAEGWQAVCLTADKDYYQLVDENITLYKPLQGNDFEVIDETNVPDKFGVPAAQVIEVLALTGDQSDNVPGVKGIGDKTAIPLVQQYGSLEGIYENIDKIDKKAVREKLIAEKENAFLSRWLVTIDTNMQMDVCHDDMELKPAKYKDLDEFFKNQGFAAIRKKWLERSLKSGAQVSEVNTENESVEEVKTIDSENVEYILVDEKNYETSVADILNSKLLAFDLETDSLDRGTCNIVGIALSNREGRAYYFPIAEQTAIAKSEPMGLFDTHDDTPSVRPGELDLSKVLESIRPALTNPNIKKCGQNAKFDAFILKRFGVDVEPISFDTMVADYLIAQEAKHNLDAMSERWLNYKPISITELIGEKKSTQISMREVDIAIAARYAGEDADLALKLTNRLDKELDKAEMRKLAEEIEFPLVKVLTDMEFNGVYIDRKGLDEFSVQIGKEIEVLTESIYKEAGIEFNIDSPKQLGHILFEKMMLPTSKKTKTGFSTDIQVLTDLAATFPIAQFIVDYRGLVKLKSTYVDALPKLINPNTGRIHTTYNQATVLTGRLSSTDPNLQNIPVRSDNGKEIRKAFVPQNPDDIIVSADYSQIELRVMAHICGDENMIEAFKNNLDIHSATASNLYGVDLDKVNSDMRRVAKTVNFGLLYGLGAFGLAQRLRIPRNEASEIINNYFAKYPKIKSYINDTIDSTRRNGYAETLCGRRRYFHDINSSNHTVRSSAERAAINMPIQGTASDMMKIAMIRIHQKFKELNLQSKLIMQVHDELVVECTAQEQSKVSTLIAEQMSQALPLGEVPVAVEVGAGKNWLLAH